MTTPEQSTGISTWDATPPYRPGLPDFNGAALTDRAEAPPDPSKMPTANLLNSSSNMVPALGQVVANAKLSIKYAAGNPVLDYGATAAGVTRGSTNPITAGKIVVVRMPGGAATGDVMVSWPASTFPPPAFRPAASLNGAAPGMIAADWVTYAPTAWTSGGAVTTSTYAVPTVANGLFYKCTTAGTGFNGAVEPTWPTTIGASTTADANGVVWTCTGYVSGCRIVALNSAAAATDLPFTVALG